MSEPLRTEPADLGPRSEAERAARIEQLLLSGLDHYFGGDYEQAIDVWSRVAFLERGHGRARAYIERARGALAERQRESEELLHSGVAAYQAGDLQRARELLSRAVEQGDANETALVFLQRLSRLDAAAELSGNRSDPARLPVSHGPRVKGSGRPTSWVSTVVASVAVASIVSVAALGTASWVREWPVTAAPGEPLRVEPLPVVRVSETRVSRARELHAAGRSREALGVLDEVDIGDPLRVEADRLRSEIQQSLLSSAVRGSAGVAGEFAK